MIQKTYGSFFSGGGLADVGAKMAGYTLAFAVEYDAKIAEVYRRNLGDHIIVADVRNVDTDALPYVDLFHASPVCTRASIANKNRGESALDIETAQATANYIERKLPKAVTIENVTQYRAFKSYQIIIDALDRCGYWHNSNNLNSADFGVPQTRRRLVVRAIRGGFVPALPAPVRWVGWYEAIADLIDTLPGDKFSNWQFSRLPTEYSNCLISNQSGFSDDSVRHSKKDEPCFSIVATNKSNSSYRAFVIDGQESSTKSGLQIVDQAEPHQTVTASVSRHPSRAWLQSGRVVRMTPRCLARFQSVLDWYELPANNRLAGKIIGNGIPCLMYRRIAELLI